jgi:hypothetical protein
MDLDRRWCRQHEGFSVTKGAWTPRKDAEETVTRLITNQRWGQREKLTVFELSVSLLVEREGYN